MVDTYSPALPREHHARRHWMRMRGEGQGGVDDEDEERAKERGDVSRSVLQSPGIQDSTYLESLHFSLLEYSTPILEGATRNSAV